MNDPSIDGRFEKEGSFCGLVLYIDHSCYQLLPDNFFFDKAAPLKALERNICYPSLASVNRSSNFDERGLTFKFQVD